MAILLVAALVLVNVLGKTDKAAADSYQFVRTTVLTKTTLSDTVSVTGTVKAGSSASVTASDSVKTYKVTAVNVAVGDTVRKGDVIATLDTTDVESRSPTRSCSSATPGPTPEELHPGRRRSDDKPGYGAGKSR